MKTVYMDYAATTYVKPEVLNEMLPYFTEKFGNPSSFYGISRETKMAIDKARGQVAKALNCDMNEVYFTGGGSESDNWAIKGIASAHRKKGNHIITTKIEHHAVLHTCEYLEKNGFEVTYLDVNEEGFIDLEELKNAITDKTILVSIMFANNEIGTIQPVKEIGAICRERKVLFHTDAVQAVGHIPIDVKEMNIDLLSASAHKFNGPKGIGFMYVKRGISIQPYMDGGSQESGLRAGTENVAAIVGMAIALKNNIADMQTTKDHLRRLEKIVVEKLSDRKIDYLLNGNKEKIPGNISLSFRDCEGEVILHRMDLMGICISTGSACDSVNTQVSHVIKAIGLPMDYAEGTIRVSFGRYNDENDAKTLVKALISIVG